MGDTTHQTTTELYLAHPDVPPSFNAMDVKQAQTLPFCGETATFRVIGNSHAVTADSLGFHEICSCKPISEQDAEVIPLEQGCMDSLASPHGVSSVAMTLPLSEFDPEADYDLCYEFGPRAYTAITTDDRTFETYHTYPEHDLLVVTTTSITQYWATTTI
ncbi:MULTISPECIES: DUF2617 family protein [Haloarcula]|uniref:DUF2617 family protein n=1 Tax=Haloarcula TaxID=2237 RepID=UPI0007BC451E|nr:MULTISPECIES: DUF2617 family protein [Haloarculaceae]KZX49025.1 hypothetical protein AV929_20105 [Haloarcula sp. K1]